MDIGLILLYLEKHVGEKKFWEREKSDFFRCIESQIPVEKVI